MMRWMIGTFEFDQPYKQTEQNASQGRFKAISKIKHV